MQNYKEDASSYSSWTNLQSNDNNEDEVEDAVFSLNSAERPEVMVVVAQDGTSLKKDEDEIENENGILVELDPLSRSELSRHQTTKNSDENEDLSEVEVDIFISASECDAQLMRDLKDCILKQGYKVSTNGRAQAKLTMCILSATWLRDASKVTDALQRYQQHTRVIALIDGNKSKEFEFLADAFRLFGKDFAKSYVEKHLSMRDGSFIDINDAESSFDKLGDLIIHLATEPYILTSKQLLDLGQGCFPFNEMPLSSQPETIKVQSESHSDPAEVSQVLSADVDSCIEELKLLLDKLNEGVSVRSRSDLERRAFEHFDGESIYGYEPSLQLWLELANRVVKPDNYSKLLLYARRAFESHPLNESLALVVCNCIVTTTTKTATKATIELVALISRSHLNSLPVLSIACEALASIIKLNPKFRADATTITFDLLRMRGQEASVAKIGLELMNTLIETDDGVRNVLVLGGCAVVMQVLKRHAKTNKDVVVLALGVLQPLCENPSGQEYAMKEEIGTLVAENTLSFIDMPHLSLISLIIIHDLSKNNVGYADELVQKQKIAPWIWQVLRKHSSSALVMNKAFSVICILAEASGANCQDLMEERIGEELVRLMEISTSKLDPETFAIGCTAMEKLSKEENCRVLLTNLSAHRVICDSVRLILLSVPAELGSNTSTSITYSNNIGAAIEALKTLAYKNQDVKNLIRNRKVVEALEPFDLGLAKDLRKCLEPFVLNRIGFASS